MNQGTSPAFLALSCIGFIASAPAVAGPLTEASVDETQRRASSEEQVVVTGVRNEEELESPKATRSVRDTPQTITVVSEETLRAQNLVTLRDALQTIPGITFGAGEGGGGYGDSINLRGFSANNDILIDGVRDSAQYSRTETFNLEQIEIANGANGTFAGAGSVGGTINIVSKTARAENLSVVQLAGGSDEYYRGTVDVNRRVSDQVAVRLNGVFHHNDVPGRAVEKFERWGIAPAVTIGLDGASSLKLQYVHQEDDNVPVFGVPYYRNTANAGGLRGVDPADYFGIVNLDRQRITFDQATARFEHDFGGGATLRNLTRWQRVGQDTVTSAPQGVYCLADGTLPTGAPCAAPNNARDTYYPSGPRGFVRDQENQLLYNQTDLRADFAMFGMRHTLVVGASFTAEDYAIATGNLLRTATGATVAQPPISISDPDTRYTGPINLILSGQSRGETTNEAVYLFDTVAIVPQLEASVGLRWEHQRGEFRADTLSTAAATLGAYTRGVTQVSDDTLFSYRFGLNYKPVDAVSIYGGYGISRTPTSATVRLGCGTLIAAPAGALDPCDVDAETARNFEVGIKAQLGSGVLLTAAAFRNERTNYRVATNDPVVTTLPVNDGRARVDGIAVGASGRITQAWSVFANYTYLDSDVRQSVSDFCLANPGPRTVGTVVTNPCGNSVAIRDPQAGAELVQVPRHSGSLFTTYTLPFGLQVGYGLTYQGSFALNTPALATPLAPTAALTPVFRSDDYLIHRASLSYRFSERLTAQLNVQNFTDELYFTGIRNNGWATPGDRRQAVFSLFATF